MRSETGEYTSFADSYNIEDINNISRKIVDTQGKRNEIPLTKEQYEELIFYAKELGFPEENIAPYIIDSPFETGLVYGNRLYINNDVLPSKLVSDNPNSLVSGKGAIAHEVVGHYETIQKGTDFRTQYIDSSGAIKIDEYNLALDEAQASIRAGRFAPGLATKERLILIKDGIMGLRNQGIKLKDVRGILDIEER